MRVFSLRAGLRVNLFVISQKGRGWSCGRRERSGIDDGIRLGGNIDGLRRRMTVENEVDSDRQYEQSHTGGCNAEVEDFATTARFQMFDCLSYLLTATGVFTVLLESGEEVGKIIVLHLLLTF